MTGCYSVCVCVTGCLQGEVDKFPSLIRTHCSSFHLFRLSPFSHTFSLPSSFTRNRFEETCAWVRQAFPWFRHSEKDVSCSPDFPNDNVAHLLLLLFSSYTSLAGDPDLFTAALTDNVFFFCFFYSKTRCELCFSTAETWFSKFNSFPNGFESKMVDPKATGHYATICLWCTLAKQLLYLLFFLHCTGHKDPSTGMCLGEEKKKGCWVQAVLFPPCNW